MKSTAADLKRMRTDAGLSQREMAELARLAHANRWSEYERDVEHIDEARLELVRIKLGLHPLYGPLAPRKA